MCDYFSYTTADIVFIDDEFNDTDGQNAAKQNSDGQADDKETATDEKTKERRDDQVITGNKTDSKENATDNKTEDDDAGEQGNITVTREHDERQHTSNKGDKEHGDDKEMATDEETKEKSDDQVITGNKTDSKQNATDNKTEDHDGVEHDAGEQGNITVTREHDEHQHTSNEGDKEHVQWSRMTSMHRDEGRTEGRYDKEFICYLCCEKFYNKSGVRTHYSHAHNMSLDV